MKAEDILSLHIKTHDLASFAQTFNNWGHETISIRELLRFFITPITDLSEKISLLEKFIELHKESTISDFARALKVTRQTIYNWKDSGYIVMTHNGKRVDNRQTLNNLKFILRYLTF